MSDDQRMGQGVAKPTMTDGERMESATSSPPVEQAGTGGDPLLAPLDLQQLIDRCMGNHRFAERILAKFESRFDDELQQLERSQAEQDADEVAEIAHRLKGSAGSVSDSGLAAISAQIEDLAQSRQLAEVSPCLASLRREWLRFMEFSSSLPRPLTDA
jgi:HPt (histidine-containing phosphotransfer) domain-containing protein